MIESCQDVLCSRCESFQHVQSISNNTFAYHGKNNTLYLDFVYRKSDTYDEKAMVERYIEWFSMKGNNEKQIKDKIRILQEDNIFHDQYSSKLLDNFIQSAKISDSTQEKKLKQEKLHDNVRYQLRVRNKKAKLYIYNPISYESIDKAMKIISLDDIQFYNSSPIDNDDDDDAKKKFISESESEFDEDRDELILSDGEDDGEESDELLFGGANPPLLKFLLLLKYFL